MARLFGKEYSKQDLLKKTGSLSQVGWIKEYTYRTGRYGVPGQLLTCLEILYPS